MILRLTKSSNALVFVPKMCEKLGLETVSGSGGSMSRSEILVYAKEK